MEKRETMIFFRGIIFCDIKNRFSRDGKGLALSLGMAELSTDL